MLFLLHQIYTYWGSGVFWFNNTSNINESVREALILIFPDPKNAILELPV